MVCVRRPHPSVEGRRTSRVWEVESTTNSILGLGDDLVALGVERVVLESTSDYWRPFFYLLEAAGLTVWLVNARDVKQVTGRPKTDKLDAVWLAKLNERGMLRPSFVPPREIRALRDYTRLRTELVEERSRHKQRLEKLLEDALIKLSSVATDLLGVSARAMIEALIAGRTRPRSPRRSRPGEAQRQAGRVARSAQRPLRRPPRRPGPAAARPDRRLHRQGRPAHHPDRTTRRRAARPPTAEGQRRPPHPGSQRRTGRTRPRAHGLTTVERLDEVPGIAERAAQIIIAEVGLDMAQFPTPAHLVSWAKLSPQTIQSGPQVQGRQDRQGQPLPQRRPRRGRHRRGQDRHVPRTSATGASSAGVASNEPSSPSPGRSW